MIYPPFFMGLGNSASPIPLSFDFEKQKYSLKTITSNDISRIPGWTFSRPGYNAIPRSVVTGAVAGTPGTDPTNWQISVNANGLTKSIVGSGTDSNGFAYVDVRFNGTPTNSNSAEIIPQQNTNVAASNGQTWTGSLYVAIVGGTTTNTVPVVNVQELNGAGATLATTIGSAISLTSISTRAATTRTNNNASTAYERVVFSLGVTTGQAVDITLRIAAPQLEPGNIAGPYQATTGTAVTSGVNTTYAETANGTLVPFGPNQSRITDRGLLVEEARTNLAKNNRFQDWTGTAPNGYSASIASRISKVQGVIGTNALRINGPFFNDGNRISAPSFEVLTPSTTYTATMRIRKTRGSTARLGIAVDSWGSNAFLFDLTSTPLGQWVTMSITATSSSSPMPSGGFHTDGTDSDLEIDWWQLEAGGFATSPIINDSLMIRTRAADNASVTGLGGILGQFRTNLLTYSQQFDNAVWGKGNTTVTADAIVAPDGTTTADKIVETAATGTHVLAQNPAAAFTSSTFSVYAKKGERNWLWIYFAAYGAGSAWFDLDAGVIGLAEANIAATITDVGNGWYRCSIRQVTGNTAVGIAVAVTTGSGVTSYLGAAGSGIYTWGAQLETGSAATAYIPTTAAPASAGNPVTLVAWADLSAADGVDRWLASLFTVTNDFTYYVAFRRDSGNNAILRVVNSTGTSLTVSGKTGARVLKSAGRIRSSVSSFSADGSGVQSVSLTPPSNLVTMFIGGNPTGGNLNGYIQRVQILGDTSDAQLQQFTKINNLFELNFI